MTLLRSVPLGCQTPRFLTEPERVTSEAVEAAEFAESLGLVLDPWQRRCLEVGLGVRGDGKWSATQVLLLVPRQNGKGSVLEAVELAGLFLWSEKLILHSAHEFKTAQEAFRRVLFLVENNDWLRRKCKKPRTSHGEEGIETLDGRRLRFVARSTGSGRGFTGDRVILDEAYALTDGQMAALLPTMSAKSLTGNPQIWYTSSAPLETSTVLHRLRRQGRNADPSLAFLEWSAPDDADVDDPEALRLANPALGIRIDDEFVNMERAALGPAEYRRERLGISPDIDSETAIPLELWQRICTDDKPGSPLAISLDCTPDRKWAAIAAADGQVVELVAHQPDVGWVVPRAFELWERWKCRFVVDGSGPAGSLAAELARLGAEVEYLGPRDVARACNGFYDDVIGARLTVLDPFGATTRAVVGAVKQKSGDTWRWGRNIDGDVSPLMAITLARWAAAGPSAPPTPLVSWR